ncbi:MAG TPA: hypothetical protein DIV86_06355 [Alphaproteobacteria bacterium]|nr:hypothetical protein [Alphaproteobacteria bacterium]
MLASFFIVFRELVEAFLVVFILTTYLTKTNRGYLIPTVTASVLFSVILSAVLGNYLSGFKNMPLIEGIMALVAAALVASLSVYMIKNGKKIASNIHNKVNLADQNTGFLKHALLFFFVLVMVSREGIEIAIMLAVVSYKSNAADILIGSGFGLLATIVLGFIWFKYNHLINLGGFLKLTSYFLIALAAYFFLYGIYELTEVKALPFVDNKFWHAQSKLLVKGFVGKSIIYSVSALPFAYLLYCAIKNGRVKAA